MREFDSKEVFDQYSLFQQPGWALVRDGDIKPRIDKLSRRLEEADNFNEVLRLQGEIQGLRYLIKMETYYKRQYGKGKENKVVIIQTN